MGTKLIKFHATWCEPCKQLSKVIEGFKPKMEAAGVEYQEIDVDEQGDTARQFGVRGVPTLVLVDMDEQRELKRHVGMANEAQLINLIHKGNA